jgi:hypothetical protein
VADEHLATAISHGALLRLFDALSTARPRAGFDVLFLGTDVPLDGLRGFVAEHQPAVIGLSFNIAIDV